MLLFISASYASVEVRTVRVLMNSGLVPPIVRPQGVISVLDKFVSSQFFRLMPTPYRSFVAEAVPESLKIAPSFDIKKIKILTDTQGRIDILKLNKAHYTDSSERKIRRYFTPYMRSCSCV